MKNAETNHGLICRAECVAIDAIEVLLATEGYIETDEYEGTYDGPEFGVTYYTDGTNVVVFVPGSLILRAI